MGFIDTIKKLTKRNDSSCAFLCSDVGYKVLCGDGYTSLDKNPEILAGCQRIAELIASMTIYLMENKEKGDKRIKNELSRHIDIYPNKNMTRFNWMFNIIMTMLVYGAGNSIVFPKTENGLLGDLIPIPSDYVSFIEDGYDYKIRINGSILDPSELLHFVYNPSPRQPWRGLGYTVSAIDVVENLKQASTTEKAFMKSEYMPNLIIKVDGLVDGFSNKDGRKKILSEYVETSERGEPWMIPAEQMEVQQVKPLSLSDLAINDSIKLNKQSVAAILGVPPFLLGVGTFNEKEWNNFINSKIRPMAKNIEQELTRKLLLSQKWYFKFNVSSLYSYDLKTTADVFANLYSRGLVMGNEVRDRLSMSPLEGLDELVILENYIPAEMIGNQKKLEKEDKDE